MQAALFSELGLAPELLQAVDKLGFEQASPIQAAAIPPQLAGQDLVGQSQTGSGKTAAFALPALQRLDLQAPGVQVLVLCPTRELAMQVSNEIHKLGAFRRGLRALPIYGGQSYERQFAGLRAGPHVVIGTPGRLIDHLDRGTLKLDAVRTVILDEADEMLNMGFRDDIERILGGTPKERQTVLFSATIPRPIEDLISRHTRQPARVRIEAKAVTVPTVEQVYFEVDRRWKFEALTRLVDLHDVKLGIIFCNTQRMVDELAEQLNAAGYTADALHGGLNQNQRERVLGRFRKNAFELLVATDVAARGIDIQDIEVVFNYDLPYDVEDYVHRIGRTGRAGRSGMALSFVSGREVFFLRQVERYTRQRLHRGRIPSDAEIEDARLGQLLQRVRETLQTGGFRNYDHLIETLLEEGHDSLSLASALLHLLAAGEGATEPAARPAKPAPPRPGSPPAPVPAPASTAKSKPAPAPSPTPTLAAAPTPAPGSAGPAPEAASAPSEPIPATPEALPAPAGDLSTPEPADAPGSPIPSPSSPSSPPDFAGPAGHLPRAGMAGREGAGPGGRPGRPGPDRGSLEPRPEPRGPRSPRDGEQRPPAPAARPRPTPPAAPAFPAPRSRPGEPRSEIPPEKPTGAKAPESIRLWIGAGEADGATEAAVRAFILGQTGLPEAVLRRVDLRERHAFVTVPEEVAAGMVAKLKRAEFLGKRIKAKLA